MAEGDVFTSTNLKVSNLVSEVDSGIIALPDLQRPFVWKDKQIREKNKTITLVLLGFSAFIIIISFLYLLASRLYVSA